jgi:two-component system LytT family sensor kinase
MTKEKARDSIAYILGFKPVKTTGQRVLVIVSHIVLWGVFLALPLLIYRIRILDITFFYRELVDKSFLIILFYVNYYFLLPRFFQRGRIAKYFLSIGCALILLCTLQVTVEYFFREHLRKGRQFILTGAMPFGEGMLRDSITGPGTKMITYSSSYGTQLSVAGPLNTKDTVIGGIMRSETMMPEEEGFRHVIRGRHMRRLNAKDSLIGVAYAEPAMPFPMGGPFGQRGNFFWMGLPMVFMNAFSSAVIILLLGGFIKLANSLLVSEKQKKALENERLNAELNFLKLQINPHFLFNTLNSIYSQAHLKSEQTEYSILKFSQIMRYVLYDSTTDKIPLTRDLEYVRNYIDLQKLRISKNITIRYEVTGATDDLLIAPLLLITFIENAFKHGISYTMPSAINVQITVTGAELFLVVSNTIIRKMKFPDQKESGGVGLANARRRLDVLYPGLYRLDINDSNNVYVVNLRIALDRS